MTNDIRSKLRGARIIVVLCIVCALACITGPAVFVPATYVEVYYVLCVAMAVFFTICTATALKRLKAVQESIST